jgi:hypothetical protein
VQISLKSEHKSCTSIAKETRVNELGKVTRKRGRVRDPDKRTDPSWVDRFAGTLDEAFARAALDRPGPESYERPDISFD